MTSLNSGITLAVIFSFVAMLGQACSIYAIIHSRTNEELTKIKEEKEKDSEMIKSFTRLEVKMDSFNQRIDSIEKTVEKSDAKLDDYNKHLLRNDERINNLENRVEILEGRK